jgi:hypothetical protein
MGAAGAVLVAQSAGAVAAAWQSRRVLSIALPSLLRPDAGDLDRLRRLLRRGGR